MDLEAIIEKISNEEEVIINLLNEVDTTLEDTDSITNWFIKVLKSHPNICEKFALPKETVLKNALLKILTKESTIKLPISYLLTNRLEQYLASLPDICSHSMGSQSIKDSLIKYNKLVRLINQNKYVSQNKSISVVAVALATHRLHLYKESNNETDLRVVLRSFYEDKQTDNPDDRNLLLDFIFKQLLNEIAQPGHISERRHLWWSIYTLMRESSTDWFISKNNEINSLIEYVLSLPEYSPSGDILKKSATPELITVENDKLWEAINICRILLTQCSDILNLKIVNKLKDRLTQDVNSLFSENWYSSICTTKNKLLLLYELAHYYNLDHAKKIIDKIDFNFKSNFIGNFLYNNETHYSSDAIIKKIENFIKFPNKWTKHTLTSLMICGAPGQGKSEFANQFSSEITKITSSYNKTASIYFSSVGTEINSLEDLNDILKNTGNNSDINEIKILIFDEIDKAEFNFYTPFLSTLEKKVDSKKESLTIWIFAQSSFPKFDQYKSMQINYQIRVYVIS